MGELRTCPVTGQVVLVNPGWPDRPAPRVPAPDPCPWCAYAGPVIAARDGVRALPHPNPTLRVEADAVPRVDGVRLRRGAVGAHEVILGAHTAADGGLLELVRDRIADLRRDLRLRGFRAARHAAEGHHAVWQLWALPFEGAPGAPSRWRDEELDAGERVIAVDPDAVAILAWAPRVPFETWVLPRAGRDTFERGVLGPVVALAERVRSRLSRALRGAEVDVFLADGEPWRLDLLPRVAPPGFFPEATGIPLHGALPEVAAEFLRTLPEAP